MTEEGGYSAVFAALSKEKELLFLSQKEVVDRRGLRRRKNEQA